MILIRDMCNAVLHFLDANASLGSSSPTLDRHLSRPNSNTSSLLAQKIFPAQFECQSSFEMAVYSRYWIQLLVLRGKKTILNVHSMYI